MPDILHDLREAQKLYKKAGVEGAEGARMMGAAADEIEKLRINNWNMQQEMGRIKDMAEQWSPVDAFRAPHA